MNKRDEIIKAIAETEAEIVRLDHARDVTIGKLQKLQSVLDELEHMPIVSAVNHSTTSIRMTKNASPDEKVKLFANLFRGRDDVFARLWESNKTGKKGYSPVCEYEWQPEICTKPKIKCTNCKYVPLTNEVLHAHLVGLSTIGLYPLRKDNSCYFLAIDFDKDGWKSDAETFLEVCNSLNVPAVLEKSRSGNGGHVWIFFSEGVWKVVICSP